MRWRGREELTFSNPSLALLPGLCPLSDFTRLGLSSEPLLVGRNLSNTQLHFTKWVALQQCPDTPLSLSPPFSMTNISPSTIISSCPTAAYQARLLRQLLKQQTYLANASGLANTYTYFLISSNTPGGISWLPLINRKRLLFYPEAHRAISTHGLWQK